MGVVHGLSGANAPALELAGHDRYVIRRRLGEGSVGVVYQATDLRTNEEVALKTLRRVEPLPLFRFKREFRALADLTHENLVSLYELSVFDGQWFFTMELVRGIDFLAYVRPGTQPDRQRTLSATAAGTLDLSEKSAIGARPLPSSAPGTADLPRLLDALRQLARGLLALHQAGMLHRDVKPSNVLVTHDNRVVLVDFGLVTPMGLAPDELSKRPRVCGSAGYMSPEQASAAPLGPSSDWYGVGVMLYEALTGQLPFQGTVDEVMRAKRVREPRPPHLLDPDVPRELSDLACELLQLDPDRRPGAAELLLRLGERVTASPDPPKDPGFVGRTSSLATLHESLRAVSSGATVAVMLVGDSGLGKSTLARRFLDEVRSTQRALVLEGRCYERESVPFKALDAIVDKLCHELTQLSANDLASILPPDAISLVHLFGVLRRLGPLSHPVSAPIDPQETRSRAFAALRALFVRMAERQPVVLFVDDLHWGDLDSAELLSVLLRAPSPPRLLFVATHRLEDVARTPFLATLRRVAAITGTERGAELKELSVRELDPHDARSLARRLLAKHHAPATARAAAELDERAEAIARESGGNPLFVAELARRSDDVRDEVPTLTGALAARVAALPSSARALLEVVCVAGRPLAAALAAQVADLPPEDHAAIERLKSEHFVRTLAPEKNSREVWIEAFHDRIREHVVAHLEPARLSQWHATLARALEARGDAGDAVAEHLEASGENDRAARSAAEAASRAMEGLAFDRAARLFRDALRLDPQRADAAHLARRLADALANAGRSAEAATAYLDAARRNPDHEDAIDARRLAAEQLLRSGHVDEGVEVLASVLARVGMKLPEPGGRAKLSLLTRRVRLFVRGTRFEERARGGIDRRVLAKIDTAWSGALGLGMIDVVRSFDFHTAHLLMALDAGEPYRVARALVGEALSSASAGSPARARTAQLLEISGEIAERIQHPHALGLVAMARGMADSLVGEYEAAIPHYAAAEQLFRRRCAGVAWELATVRHMHMWALAYGGELGRLGAQVPALLEDARARGDLYAANHLASGLPNLAWLAGDDPAGARRALDESMAPWSHRGFHLQHYNELLARVHLDLYTDRGEMAARRVTSRWRVLKQSNLLRVQQIRIEALHLRGRASLAAATRAPAADAAALLCEVEHGAGRIAAEGLPWGAPLSTLLLAGVAHARGDFGAALTGYVAAERSASAAGLALYAAVARLRQGELIGPDQGTSRMAAAERWLVEHGVRSPGRIADVFAPVP